MKKHHRSILLLGTAFSIAATSSASAAVYSFSGAGLLIPDSGAAIPSIISVSGIPLSESVVEVTVSMAGVFHTWSNDIRGRVTSPLAELVTLWNFPGNDEDAVGSNWLFSDAAAVGLGNISQSGTFLPITGPALATFNSDNPNGNWTLDVFDQAGGDQGSIASWTLNITTIPEPTGAVLAGLVGFGCLVRRRRPASH